MDKLIRATSTKFPIRYVLTKATNSCMGISNWHQASGYVSILLSEAVVGSLLLATRLKTQGAIQISQVHSGEISNVISEATPMGLVRAKAPQSEIQKIGSDEPGLIHQKLEVSKFGPQGKNQYQSIIEAPSQSLGPNLAAYLLQSEQTRSAVGIEAKLFPGESGSLMYSIGFLVEAFPDATEQDILEQEKRVQELPELSHFYKQQTGGGDYDLYSLLGALAGNHETEIIHEVEVRQYCPCTKARAMDSIKALGKDDLVQTASKGEALEVKCDYCRQAYVISPKDLTEIASEM